MTFSVCLWPFRRIFMRKFFWLDILTGQLKLLLESLPKNIPHFKIFYTASVTFFITPDLRNFSPLLERFILLVTNDWSDLADVRFLPNLIDFNLEYFYLKHQIVNLNVRIWTLLWFIKGLELVNIFVKSTHKFEISVIFFC